MDVKKVVAVALLVMGVLIAGMVFSGKDEATSSVVAEASVDTSRPSSLRAPEFTLTDIHGNDISLSDYEGSIVILNFWATWCGPCRFEIPDLMKLQEAYEGDIVVIGVSLDYNGPKVVPQFVERLGISYPVVYGNGSIANRYGGIVGIPTTFVIDRKMNVFRRYVGYRPKAVLEKDIKALI